MPGLVKMENGGQNGARTDHNRDVAVNGINGVKNADGSRGAPDKSKATTTNNGSNANGGEADGPRSKGPQQQANTAVERRSRMNDLPDEIIHITHGFVPLHLLLTRLAQTTHNKLQEKIAELAKMPVPAAATNGNSTYGPGSPDDTSSENVRKKAVLLQFAHEWHSKWVKALVITEWSRKAGKVSELIDLKFHIDQQRILYDAALDNLVNVKRDLTYARIPSPDLKTALQILSTGTAPFLPDLGYIEPPPLTAEEQLKWMNDVNTLLSLRLNLEDYDKIPFHFRNYEISSGRVTFKVPGEFEVDLTIADEDFEKQFWFIDFRYAFSPAASSLPDSLRGYLEACVNEALSKDGLTGCYNFLHEFVLTSKISELKRQALQLSRNAWTGTLMVEPLNRALAIHYWTSRTPAKGPKSWVLVAVNSGRKQDGRPDPKASSYLEVKWYRENKEVKDVEIELDVKNLSAESLLKSAVGRHIHFILSSIHEKLLATPRLKNREAGMVLNTSQTDPVASSLSMQVGYRGTVSLLIEPTTGAFAVKPHSKFSIHFEHQLNNGNNPAEDGVVCIEQIRCGIMEDELNRRGGAMGWFVRKVPMAAEELRSITKIRNWNRAIWLQREGWGPTWFVVVFLSLDGDEWWLLETNSSETNGHPRFQARLPLNKGHPQLSDAFWTNLTIFATGMITQSVDMRELHRHKIKSRSNGSINLSLPQQVRLPSIEVALSALFPTMVLDNGNTNKETTNTQSHSSGEALDNLELLALMRPGMTLSSKPWADDIVTIKFRGVESLVEPMETSDGSVPHPELICISDAIIKIRKPTKFAALKEMVDSDVSYNPQRGEFSLQIQRRATESILPTLKSRIKAIDRFVNFFEAMDKANGAITSESVSLGSVTFAYGGVSPEGQPQPEESSSQRWRVTMKLSQDDIDIDIEQGNPHLRVIDLMRRLVNSDGGICALMAWLPISLPALKAVEKIESQWDNLASRGQGRLEFSMKNIGWMNLRYTVFGSTKAGQKTKKHVTLDVRVKPRRGEAWWHAWRSDVDAGDDEFTSALKSIWDSKGDNWLGLATSAAGRPNNGVASMLLAIDGAIQGVASKGNQAQSQKPGGSSDVPMVLLD